MDDSIDFLVLRLDKNGSIDKSEGYYKFSDGRWKRKLLGGICVKLNIALDLKLAKQTASLKGKQTLTQRIDNYFQIYKAFFKNYNDYLLQIETLN